ncbi:acyl-CoA dehydrogenase family protein [Streptomyces polychromogenes]|uniref:Acyl-CoA dehydrogenase family protein n=1 Tax=Streptomyces polychromogenes TaxID=67342 RepID=A0ABP3EL91_9ACTN
MTAALDEAPALPGGGRAGAGEAGWAGAVEEVAAVVAEHGRRNDELASFPVEALSALRASGLMGLLVPAAYGGLGGGVREMSEVTQRLGRADMSVAMIFTMHCQQVAALARYAGQDLRDELLPEIAAGRIYLASVTTEAGKGGHLLSSGSPLESDEAGRTLMVDRFAPIVTGGLHADGFLITMRSPYSDSPSDVSLVYAPRELLEITPSGDWQPLGMRASHSVGLRLTGQVPGHYVVGEHGRFRDVASGVFAPLAHIGWSAAWLGTACGALSRVVALLRSPAERGRYDLSSELLLTRLATARRRLDTVHALLLRTVDMTATAEDLTTPACQLLLNALKVTASEECHAAVQDLVDLLGLRHGYLRDSPTGLERALRDLRSAALNYSNDRLRLAAGRLALLDSEVRLVR